ncbi:uncharacterized protein ARMOST_17691 [Armillaria ostoyae]|uniref:Uncharacterized protein n=1 Tax=Armillaria ostoyae TaxID=47428 RepID=A0A284RZQ2_ARMOS|nr:uncharacterized protein ARMOST_17691 [Armillaria ostoyae]
MPKTMQINPKSTNPSKAKIPSAKAKTRPMKPAMKPVIQQAPQERDGSEVESEDDVAPVLKKGRMDQQRGKAKKSGTQKTPPAAASDEEDIEEDDIEEDDIEEDGAEDGATEEDIGDDVDGMAGGWRRKAKSGSEAVPTRLEVKVARKQKRYKVLQQITSDDGETPAKQKENMEECIKILSDAHTWGKLMPRAINLWVEPEDVLLEGIEHLLGSERTSENNSNLKAFDALTSFWSIDLSKDLEYFVDADDGMSRISTALHKGFRSTRQEDTHKICDSILKIIVKDPRKESLPLPIPMIKSAQGFNYCETARLLCPQINVKMFDNDDEWRQQLREGKIKISHWELLSFLFNQSKASSEDDLVGCMEGFVLVRTVKHLLTSDGIPGKSKGPTRPSIAKMYKIKKMTGRLIVYGACQAHYALSSLDSWTRRDGKFDLQMFYYSIVDMYEDFPEDPWAVASLAWWNKEVFGSLDGADEDNDNDNNTPPPESTVFKMAEARRQRQKLHKAVTIAAQVAEEIELQGEISNDAVVAWCVNVVRFELALVDGCFRCIVSLVDLLSFGFVTCFALALALAFALVYSRSRILCALALLDCCLGIPIM